MVRGVHRSIFYSLKPHSHKVLSRNDSLVDTLAILRISHMIIANFREVGVEEQGDYLE
jgi:hypothetical protein